MSARKRCGHNFLFIYVLTSKVFIERITWLSRIMHIPWFNSYDNIKSDLKDSLNSTSDYWIQKMLTCHQTLGWSLYRTVGTVGARDLLQDNPTPPPPCFGRSFNHITIPSLYYFLPLQIFRPIYGPNHIRKQMRLKYFNTSTSLLAFFKQ